MLPAGRAVRPRRPAGRRRRPRPTGDRIRRSRSRPRRFGVRRPGWCCQGGGRASGEAGADRRVGQRRRRRRACPSPVRQRHRRRPRWRGDQRRDPGGDGGDGVGAAMYGETMPLAVTSSMVAGRPVVALSRLASTWRPFRRCTTPSRRRSSTIPATTIAVDLDGRRSIRRRRPGRTPRRRRTGQARWWRPRRRDVGRAVRQRLALTGFDRAITVVSRHSRCPER